MARSTTEKLGDVLVAVGNYTPTGQQQPKSKNRNIGSLMQTTDESGNKRFWLKMNADILQPSLFALVRAESMEKGDDQFTANVLPPRDQAASTAKKRAAGEDDQPY